MSLLPSVTVPSVAVSSPISTLAKVDLPQPDSPTIATVSASRASKLSRLVGLDRRGPRRDAEHLAAADLVVFLQVLDLEHRRAGHDRSLPSWPPAAALPVDLVEAHAARRNGRRGRRPRSSGFRPRRRRPSTKWWQRGPKLQPFGRSCGSGNWPGMATSGRAFLSAPGSGIERNSPRV